MPRGLSSVFPVCVGPVLAEMECMIEKIGIAHADEIRGIGGLGVHKCLNFELKKISLTM